jgi:hypothetical protein
VLLASLFVIGLLSLAPFASLALGQQDTPADAEEITVANDDRFEVSAGAAALIMGPRDLLRNDVPLKQRKLHVCDYDDEGLLGELQVRRGVGFVYFPGPAFKELLRSATKMETFKYQVHDGSGGSDWATVDITVKGTKAQSLVHRRILMANGI